MKKRTQFVIFSLLFCLSGCAPKITGCVIDFPIGKSHCVPPNQGHDYDMPIDQMDKYTCFSPLDFADLLRGNMKNITACTIVSVKDDDVHCSTPKGSIETILAAIHKYTCLNVDDMAEYMRWYRANKKK